MIRVSIIEDNAEERALYAGIVDATSDLRCVSQHPNAAHALRRLREIKPDVVLVDIEMPGCTGVECVRQIRSLSPRALCLMLTKHEENDYIFDSLRAGAAGYLIKAKVRDALPDLIRQARREEAVMTPEIARRVLAHFRAHEPASTRETRLTPREEEVLRLIAQGFTSKEISTRLNCTPITVDRHAQHICQKLHVSGRVAAASRYFRRGLDRG